MTALKAERFNMTI